MKLNDTIAAVSTPRGKGGVAMIRISGEDAIAVAERVFLRASEKPLGEAPSAKMVRGRIIDFADKREIDDGMAAVFRAPYSFTGENTVEIYCHGGVLVTEQVLCSVLLAGARAAEAGEFTRRAFVNGKMSLSEAEALGALLEAKTTGQARLARGGMKGHLARKTREIYDSLLSVMTGIYAAIDFPDEDLNEFSREEIADILRNSACEIERLATTYKTGRAVSEGIQTVICGKANAGKSSVYNRIVGYNAAIVTDIEGTTRDVLRQTATLGSTTLLLCDTAGIRQTSDTVESIGIERALDELEGAELVLAVFDSSAEADSDDEYLLNRIEAIKQRGTACIALLNKSDLSANQVLIDNIKSHFETCIEISAATGEGFDTLSGAIDAMFIDGSISLGEDAVVTGARQHAALLLAAESLKSSLEELLAGTPLDLVSIGIESALTNIGMLDGRQLGEEIVAEIFSKFCVGK